MSCRVVRKADFSSGSALFLDYSKRKSLKILQRFTLSWKHTLNAMIYPHSKDTWTSFSLCRERSVSENMPLACYSLVFWTSSDFCPLSHLKRKVLATLYACTSAARPAAGGPGLALFSSWIIFIREHYLNFPIACGQGHLLPMRPYPSCFQYDIIFSLFNTTFGFGFAHPFQLNNVFKHTPMVA